MAAVRRVSRVWLAATFIAVAVAINIIFAATGHTHAGRNHPGWVEVLSWVFLGCALALVVIVVQALRAYRRARRGSDN